MNRKRVSLAERYNARLADLAPAVETPTVTAGATHVYQMYTITVPAEQRDAILTYIRARGVGASVHFDPPVHLQSYYMERGAKRGDLPATEELVQRLITLPIYPDMTHTDQDWVVDCLRDACREYFGDLR
jgi:dTDP-4-amino-4,6-dideoxygalactose transaminase